MIDFLVKLFIRDPDKTEEPAVRARYGTLAGGVGILLNLCLFAAKFAAGLLTASIAITADAFNNLSDAGSSVVTLVGFKMAGMPSDQEHPFGHGRIEYLSGLAVALAILLVGVELGRSSIDKILHPEAVSFSVLSVCILLLSVAVKLWMSHFNRTLGKRLHSSAMRATAMDSLTDAVATSAVVAGILVSLFFHVNLDGWIGILVAAFILYSGFTTARDSLSPLLGEAPDKEFVQAVSDTVMAHNGVAGIHDLVVHDYGPGRRMISLHAEMPCNMDILVMHDMIDVIELELRHKFNCEVTIHMDPIELNNAAVMEMKQRVAQMVREIDPALSIHDFRMVTGSTHTNLIFDVVMPHKFHLTAAQITAEVRRQVESLDGRYFAVVRVEAGFT